MDTAVERGRGSRAGLAGLERIDRLVLGGVELEDAPKVGQQREHDQIADKETDANDALGRDEQKRVLNRQEIRHHARHDLEEDDAKDDGYNQRNRNLAAPDLLFALTLALMIARGEPRGQRQRLHADRERLTKRDNPANHGPAQDRMAERDGSRILDHGRDASVRTPDSNSPCRWGAHHHALHNGLSSDRLAHCLPSDQTRTRPAWPGAC